MKRRTFLQQAVSAAAASSGAAVATGPHHPPEDFVLPMGEAGWRCGEQEFLSYTWLISQELDEFHRAVPPYYCVMLYSITTGELPTREGAAFRWTELRSQRFQSPPISDAGALVSVSLQVRGAIWEVVGKELPILEDEAAARDIKEKWSPRPLPKALQ